MTRIFSTSSEKLKFLTKSIHHREVALLPSAAASPLLVDAFFAERQRLPAAQLAEAAR